MRATLPEDCNEIHPYTAMEQLLISTRASPVTSIILKLLFNHYEMECQWAVL